MAEPATTGTTRHYAITHHTRYRYAGVVTRSYGMVHQRPRELAWQQVHEHRIELDPEPAERSVGLDLQGNTRTWFLVEHEHQELTVSAYSRISVGPHQHQPAALALPWEQARPRARPDRPDAWRQVELTLDSPLVDLEAAVGDYARPSFLPGRPVGEVVQDLTTRIHADFDYDPEATTVTTRVAELLQGRRGVCQDFAQLMIACLRSQGLAGRYVSGYLATTPPPGRPRLVGADASHAWAGCWLPGPPGSPPDEQRDWLYADPTNARLCDQSHATVAWGRDYGDVAPLRGVIFSRGSGSSLSVSVDMAPDEMAPDETVPDAG